MTSPSISVTRASAPRELPPVDKLGFGQYFTDHMFLMDWDRSHGWHDPRIVPYGPISLDPAAAVLHYGQELFDGFKAFRGDDDVVRLFRPDRHWKRMRDGAVRLCMPPVDEMLAHAGLVELIRIDRRWVPQAPGTALYARPVVIATEPFLGVRPAERYLFFLILSPVGAYYAEGMNPVRIWVEREHSRAARGGLGATKTGANYAASLYSAFEAKKRGFAQVLWLDAAEHEYLEEVGTMNLFLRIGDEVVTPPLGGTILPGVTRDSVITLLGDWGIRVTERRIGLSEVVAAHRSGALKEVFGTGTAAVISPVGELATDGERIIVGGGKIGELSARLYDEITGLQRGTRPDRHGWLVAVA